MTHSLLIKNNECLTYQFMKILGNVKYQYFHLSMLLRYIHYSIFICQCCYDANSFVNVVTIHLSMLLRCQVLIQIVFNNLKLLYLSLCVINNQSEIETNWGWREIETNLQSLSQAFDCIWAIFSSGTDKPINFILEWGILSHFSDNKM